MGMLCAVSFNRYGRLYYLDPGEFSPQVGDRVLVPTDDGPEVAECVWAAQWVSEDTDGFPKVAGLADDKDLRRDELLRKRKAEAKVAAKKPLNPLRISGACGRLMCCLKYEHPLYQKFQATAPAVGSRVTTPEGDGRVVAHSVPKDAVVVRMDADGSRCSCSRASVCSPRQAHDERYSEN
jgi:cell fate regulator YaaT (PSP1 superfamily)